MLEALPAEHEPIVALVLPIVISILVQAKMNPALRSLVALAVCFVATALTNAVEGDPFGQGIGTVVVTTFVAYKAFYQPLNITDRVEDFTNLGGDSLE